MIYSVLLSAVLTMGQAAAPMLPGEQETSITNATGNLREWQPDATDPQALFVRDRALRWYRVVLNGDCLKSRRYDAIRYTTDNAGRFDRLSRVTFPPNLTCLVDSVRRSPPPPSVKRPR
jgi:hypothetical protein